MADDTFIQLDAGKKQSTKPLNVSTGASDAGKMLKTNSAGKLDQSFLPTGVGPDLLVAPADEDLAAGNYVNVFDDAGTIKVRKADNSNGRNADGFVKDAVISPANAEVFFEGPNDAVAGKTKAARQFLGTLGGTIEVALDPNANPGKLHQFLGKAVDVTVINTDIEDCITL